MGGMLGLATYGGRVNAIAPDATASAHRAAIFDLACSTGWLDPKEAAQNLAWMRAFHADLSPPPAEYPRRATPATAP